MHLMVMLAMTLGMLIIVSLLSAVPIYFFDIYSNRVVMITQTVTQLAVFFVPVLLMTTIYYKGQAREYYRLNFGRNEWLLALAGLVVWALLVPAIDWLTAWNDGWNLGRVGEYLRSMQNMTEGIVESMLSATGFGGLLANLLVVALVPAVCEEVFFRAGIQNLLQRWFRNPHAAIWVTAIVFSLGHGEIFSFMPRLLLGALLGYLYVYSGSILANSLVHFMNNAMVVLIYWLVGQGVLDIDPSAPLALGESLTICCALAAVGVLWVTFFGKKKKNSAV